MKELIYGLFVLACCHFLVLVTLDEGKSDKEAWAALQPKKTLGYLAAVSVVKDRNHCGDITTLRLQNGVEVRACGTFPIVQLGAAVEVPTTEYAGRAFADDLVFCVGDICRLAPW